MSEYVFIFCNLHDYSKSSLFKKILNINNNKSSLWAKCMQLLNIVSSMLSTGDKEDQTEVNMLRPLPSMTNEYNWKL